MIILCNEEKVVRTSSWSMWIVNLESRSMRSSLDIPSGIILGMAATHVLSRSSLGFTGLQVGVVCRVRSACSMGYTCTCTCRNIKI